MSASGETPQNGAPAPVPVNPAVPNGENATAVKPPTRASARASIEVDGEKTNAAEKPSADANGVKETLKDTSWFKRSCKEVVALLKPGKNKPQGTGEVINDRGLHIQHSGDRYAAVFINSDQLWHSAPQILKYFFLAGDFAGTEVQKQKVRDAIEEWTWYANVEFKETTSATESNIRIRFDPNDGSWSYVGKQNERIGYADPTMNLAWLDKSSTPITTNERAVILHEFGHVLGLLHEHQSPAHGGTAVHDIQAAIDLYTTTQGWSIQQVYDQVINVYAMSDVSNFSQVDTKSIMHYPQPKELTGLPEDIPYNYKLTDLDKAYMILQYPRKEMHARAKAEGWSFERALTVMGAPEDIKTQVLRQLLADRDPSTGEISPENTRQKIEFWTRSVHSKSGGSTTPAASFNPAQTVANVKQYGLVTAEVQEGDDLCSDEATDTTESGKPAHAVNNEPTLCQLPNDGNLGGTKITYTIRAKDESGTSQEVTKDQESLVKEAMNVWSSAAAITFVVAKAGTSVDLVIQFNNMKSVQPEAKPRSRCALLTTEQKANRSTEAARSTWDTLKADINYYGIFPSTADAVKYSSKRFKSASGEPVNGAALNLRSVIHELGHWLGLKHEYVGLYGYWMHNPGLVPNPTKFKENLANKYYATRYDAGSVMDAIGMRLTDQALDILKEKGLQPASVTALQDKTQYGALSRVNISLALSQYDEANIALIYPGSNLVEVSGSGMFSLRKSPDLNESTSLEGYLKYLKLYSTDRFEAIASNLRAGRWQAARKVYLAILGEAQTQEANSRKTFFKFISDSLKVEKTQVSGVFDVLLASGASPKDPSHAIGAPIGSPSHLVDDATGSQTAAQTVGPPSTGESAFIWKLYHELKQLYSPGGGQYLALQFPTRFLDKQTYAYKLDGYFSRFNKPVVVNEAEFALTDQLYDIGAIVGGPNGQSLSKNYEKALNSLIPTFENIEVRKQREKMRAWLMKETKAGNTAYTVDTRLSIPGIDADTARELSSEHGMVVTPAASGEPLSDQAAAKRMAQQAIGAIKNSARADPRGMTRMEYADSLMQAYLNDRKDWELRRDEMIKEASEKAGTDPQAMERLTRTLAHITAIEEAKLGAKYADAVVRGYSHTVRGFMGHLDIKSTAESLQDAKDSFRESALSSVYAASKVYPVAMQPTDWFEALDTSFTREDLSQDKELIRAAVTAKSQLIDALETQISNLRAFNKGDPADAKQKMEAAAKQREEEMGRLNNAYTASTISAVKLAIEVAAAVSTGGATEAAALSAKATLNGIMSGPDSANKKSLTDIFGADSQKLNEIGDQMDKVGAANLAVNQASRELTGNMSDYALAVAGDTKTMIESLQRQLTSAKSELTELQQSFTIALRAPQTTDGTLTDVGKLPQGNGGSRWSELHVKSTVSNSYTDSSSTSSSSVSSFNCNFWIGSAAGSTATTQAENNTSTKSANLEVDVSMRTTYVTADRSGWFDPSLFDMSKSFMRGTTAENYTPYAEWKDPNNTPELAAKAITDNTSSKPGGYFAAFPVGYILVKDCVIRITTSTTDLSSFKKMFDTQSQTSGGFLCFSHSSASKSSSDSSASTSRQTSNGIVVRIPGPQILGYIMQLVGHDQSQPFTPTPEKELFIEDAEQGQSNPGRDPAHDLGPVPPSNSSGARQATVRHYDEEFQRPSGSSGSTAAPAHAVQDPAATKPAGHLIDALQTALGDSEVAKWLESQPGNTRDELWSKLSAAFGKAANAAGPKP